MKHYKILVSGKVQGVYFRVHTKEIAESLNLVGFVKNTQDGKVYIEVEGLENSIDKFLNWCKEGSPEAVVEKVETQPGQVADFKTFEIKY